MRVSSSLYVHTYIFSTSSRTHVSKCMEDCLTPEVSCEWKNSHQLTGTGIDPHTRVGVASGNIILPKRQWLDQEARAERRTRVHHCAFHRCVAFESSVSKSRALTRAHSREPYVAASPPTYVVVGFQAERVEQPVAAGLVDVDVLVEVVLVEVVVVLVVVTGRAGAGHESERTDEIHTASECGYCP
jgi:hypothetical protein